MKSDLVDIPCEVRAETDKALQIFDGDTTCWLPKSQVEIERPQHGHAAPTIVTMPEWLAKERGLI